MLKSSFCFFCGFYLSNVTFIETTFCLTNTKTADPCSSEGSAATVELSRRGSKMIGAELATLGLEGGGADAGFAFEPDAETGLGGEASEAGHLLDGVFGIQ